MGVDINLLRIEHGGNPEIVRQSEIRRGRSGSLVDRIIEADKAWKAAQYKMEEKRAQQNAVNKEIAATIKAKGDVKAKIELSGQLKAELPVLENAANELRLTLDRMLREVGNIVEETVMTSTDEADNVVLRTWGDVWTVEARPWILPHYEILSRLNAIEMKRAGAIAGHRAYFLRKYGVMLAQAIIQYGLSFLRRRGYCDIQPPFFMRRDVMTQTAELKDFEETLYKIPGKDEREDLFLIATSEQPLCALHGGEYFESKDLPKLYVGVSSCFRKEAGSHGKDMKGIFRVHQFEKVEQFVICAPSESRRVHEEMISASECFYQSLGIPYRVVSIVSGALNDAGAKKYDLEAWFPSDAMYRELVSCTNCTDYQARDLSIRFGTPKVGEREKAHVHMLNGTLTAAERTLCCLVEHYQTPDGVSIPRPLQPYMDGLSFLPYDSPAV